MKRFKSTFLLIAVLTVSAAFTGCSDGKEAEKETPKKAQIETQREAEDPAKAVIEKYFEYRNQKDKEKLAETVTPRMRPGVLNSDLTGIDYINILNIEENNDEKTKEIYLNNGAGNAEGAKLEDLKVYKVEYEAKYNTPGAQDDGIYTWNYFVIRDPKSGKWLISDFGV